MTILITCTAANYITNLLFAINKNHTVCTIRVFPGMVAPDHLLGAWWILALVLLGYRQ